MKNLNNVRCEIFHCVQNDKGGAEKAFRTGLSDVFSGFGRSGDRNLFHYSGNDPFFTHPDLEVTNV